LIEVKPAARRRSRLAAKAIERNKTLETVREARLDADFVRFADQCPDAVLVTDRDGRIEYANAVVQRITGYTAAELLGRTPAILKSGRHEADFYRALWGELLAGREFRAVFANRRKGGELYYEEKIIRPLLDGAGQATRFASFGRDATERAHEIERLERAATHDSLTDLPNRRLFLDRLELALRQAARSGGPLTLALLDLDRFRDANNRYGHLAGDAVLQAVAARTRACLRETDTVARVGGDEFALILPGADEPQAAAVLRKVLAGNCAPVPFGEHAVPSSVSIGACCCPRDAKAAGELRAHADAAMYQAKQPGGNRVVFYRPPNATIVK
jgi:diguanylate cyclase (GGDEF)-like protein/PAS domain S-box-containing protein